MAGKSLNSMEIHHVVKTWGTHDEWGTFRQDPRIRHGVRKSIWPMRSGRFGHIPLIPIPNEAVYSWEILPFKDLPGWVFHIRCIFLASLEQRKDGLVGTYHTFSTNSMMRAWPETRSQRWTRWAVTWDFQHPSVFFCAFSVVQRGTTLRVSENMAGRGQPDPTLGVLVQLQLGWSKPLSGVSMGEPPSNLACRFMDAWHTLGISKKKHHDNNMSLLGAWFLYSYPSAKSELGVKAAYMHVVIGTQWANCVRDRDTRQQLKQFHEHP